MAPLGYLEVLDARGHVAERVRIDSLPLNIGRAYTNDVVVNDPYVCAQHARIASDEQGRLICRDLDSINGLHDDSQNARVTSLELHSGSQFRIGHTILRYCGVDHPMAPTLIDREERGALWKSPYAAVLAGAVVLILLCLDAFLGSVERVTAAKVLSEPLMTMATLLGWAGLWALAGRIIVSRFHFPQHATIACGAILGFLVLSAGSEWIEFFFPVVPALWIAGLLGSGVILAALVYHHLAFASPMQRLSRLGTALLVSAASIGLSVVLDFAARAKFSTVMEYTGILKPIDAAWLPATSIDRFVEDTENLKKELGNLTQKAKQAQP